MLTPKPSPFPRIVADLPLDSTIEGLLQDQVELIAWQVALDGNETRADGIYTYGHRRVDAAMLDRFEGLKVIGNYGVGVDHINLADADARGIAVGNTPGVLEATTADMGFALLLASARCVFSGDLYARSSEFARYDPGYMLGREVHGKTLGIIGLGEIGWQVARRALGFDMSVLYHNRRRAAGSRATARFIGAIYHPRRIAGTFGLCDAMRPVNRRNAGRDRCG